MSLKSTLEHAQQCVVAIIINRGVAGEVVEITVERSGAASKILRRLVCNLRLGVNERRTLVAAFIGGALIGALGGLIGLGGLNSDSRCSLAVFASALSKLSFSTKR